jgi:uncharacterized membrane protein
VNSYFVIFITDEIIKVVRKIKSKLIRGFLLLIIMLFSFTNLPIDAQRSFAITDYNTQIKILENGNLQVREIFEYNFNGDFNGMIRSIGIKGSDGLQYFKASEYSPEYKELEYTQSFDGDMVTYKIYDQSSNEIKSFLLEYQLKNVVTLYNDTAELYWKFFDQSNTSPISHIKIEIELPKGEVSAEELKVFGHGPLNGTVYIQEDKKILYEVNSLSSGEMVEARILFPTRLISSGYKIIKENKFAEIIKEELGWAKKSDLEKMSSKDNYGKGLILLDGWKWEIGEYGIRYITGIIENKSNKTYSYAQVEFNLYDDNDFQIGSTFDNVNNIEPNGKWKFKAIIIEDEARKAKLIGITGF